MVGYVEVIVMKYDLRIKIYGGLFFIFLGKFLYLLYKYNNFRSSMAYKFLDYSKYPQWYKDAVDFNLPFLAILLISIASISIIDTVIKLYKSGWISKHSTMLIRLFIVVSTLWVILIAVATKVFTRYSDFNSFILVAIVPIIIFWGIVWIVSAKTVK